MFCVSSYIFDNLNYLFFLGNIKERKSGSYADIYKDPSGR